MKKLVLLALCLVLMLTACSNYRVEITEPESGAQTSASEEEKITEVENFPESDFPKLTAKMQQSFLAALEDLAAEYRSGKREIAHAANETTDFAFPEPITAEDFYFQIVRFEGNITGYNAVFPDNDEKGVNKFYDRASCTFSYNNEKWKLEGFWFSAAYVEPTSPDHTAVETGFGTEYVNEDFGIRIDFSEIWDNSYTPVETEEDNWGTEGKRRKITVYYKDCVPGCEDPYYADWGAYMFDVVRVTHAEWDAMEAEEDVPHTWDYIDEIEDWVYYYLPSLSNECGGADAKLCAEIMTEGKQTVTVLKTQISKPF